MANLVYYKYWIILEIIFFSCELFTSNHLLIFYRFPIRNLQSIIHILWKSTICVISVVSMRKKKPYKYLFWSNLRAGTVPHKSVHTPIEVRFYYNDFLLQECDTFAPKCNFYISYKVCVSKIKSNYRLQGFI